MPTFQHTQTYEVHRPLVRGSVSYQMVATALMGPAVKEIFFASRENAGNKTAGPLMVGLHVGCTNGKDLERLYWESLKEGLDPCYVDKRDGFVYVGGAIFVPTERNVLHVDTDILTQ